MDGRLAIGVFAVKQIERGDEICVKYQISSHIRGELAADSDVSNFALSDCIILVVFRRQSCFHNPILH